MSATPDIRKIIEAEEMRRGRSSPGYAPQPAVQQTTQPAPVAGAFAMQNPLSPAQYIQMLQFTRNPIQVHHESMSGQGSVAQLDTVGGSLQIDALTELEAQFNAAPVEVRPVQAFLNPIFIEGTIIRKVAPQLVFLPMANRSTVPSRIGREIVWYREQFSPFNDPKLTLPRETSPGDVPPLTTVSDPIKKTSTIGRYSLGIRFTEEAMLNDVSGFNEVSRKLDSVAYALAFQWNKLYGDAIANRFDATFNASLPVDDQVLTKTITTPWDATSGGDVITDILDAQLQMKSTDEFFYPPTRLLLNPNTFLDVFKFLLEKDADWALNPLGLRRGPTDTAENVIVINGLRIEEVPPLSGIPDGKGLMVAQGAGIPPILDVWDLINPAHSRSNSVHVERLDDIPRGSHNVQFNFWRDVGFANRNPKAVLVLHDLRP